MKKNLENLVLKAFALLGRDEKNKKKFVNFLLELEPSFYSENFNAREEITGPLVDALYQDSTLINRQLSNGLQFSFPYSSKISRDFVMSVKDRSDHVWEPQTTKLLLKLVHGASHVLIGGAYFGDHAILLANENRLTNCMVHCFEINALQFACLKNNATINNLTNLCFNQIGLWDVDGKNLKLEGEDALAHCTEVLYQDDTTFPTITIDSYAKSNDIDKINLIVLDIEGGELQALKGATSFLSLPQDTAPNIVF